MRSRQDEWRENLPTDEVEASEGRRDHKKKRQKYEVAEECRNDKRRDNTGEKAWGCVDNNRQMGSHQQVDEEASYAET